MDSQRLLRVVLIVGVLVKQDICAEMSKYENTIATVSTAVATAYPPGGEASIHSEVPKEELGLMILSPRVSLPQNMEEGCFFRLFIMTQKRARKDTEKLERGKGRDGLRWMSLYRCLFMPVRQTKGSAQLVGFYKIIND